LRDVVRITKNKREGKNELERLRKMTENIVINLDYELVSKLMRMIVFALVGVLLIQMINLIPYEYKRYQKRKVEARAYPYKKKYEKLLEQGKYKEALEYGKKYDKFLKEVYYYW
jgi:hypothetical protein